jgi:hypothetical protein
MVHTQVLLKEVLAKKKLHELAVMIDPFAPVMITEEAIKLM